MSNMIRATIFAIGLGMATAEFEWKGIFHTPDDSYKWLAQKVDGAYADADMELAVIPTSAYTAEALASATAQGTTAFSQSSCESVQSGGVIKAMENKCYKLVFDQSSSESTFTIDTSETAAVAFFAQHLPTEFENTDHYFKDLSGVDIEPQAQDPEPGAGGHSHGHGGGSTAPSMEWRGIFYTPDDSYKWLAQKVDGAYVDPTMMLAAIPTSTYTAEALVSATALGTTAMSQSCESVNSGEVMKAMENKCYILVFDQSNSQSTFTVDTSATTAVAFFAQHLPTEFEDTDHYFKDLSGVDIEPQAQDPDPGAGHSHGHGADDFSGICVCQAAMKGWELDCANQAAIQAAIDALEAKAACMAVFPPDDCIDNYYLMQAHHDHCLHDQLPTTIEKALHDYEHFYMDCFVKRQFDPDLSKCPTVECNDDSALTTAIATLQAGCSTSSQCEDPTCAAAVKTVLMAHDVCPEAALPDNLEKALHDHEEPCAKQLCNSADGPFDPYDTPCRGEASGAGRFGCQGAFLVTMSALMLVMLISS